MMHKHGFYFVATKGGRDYWMFDGRIGSVAAGVSPMKCKRWIDATEGKGERLWARLLGIKD